MSGDGKGPSPPGKFVGILLMAACCAGPLLLVGGGGAAIGGFLGDNLWPIIGGMAVLAIGIILLKGRGTEGDR